MTAVRVWIAMLTVAALLAPPAALVSGARPGQPPHLGQAPPAEPQVFPCLAGRQEAGVSRWALASRSASIGPLAAAAAAFGRPPAHHLASAAAAATHCISCMRTVHIDCAVYALFLHTCYILATSAAHCSSLS